MNFYHFFRLFYEIFQKDDPNTVWIEKQGLLAVKIAQTFALRADFLSPVACQQLGRLYQHTTPVPGEAFFELLDSYTSTEWKSNFSEIAEAPLASASIGQVHKGTLQSEERVVIKAVKNDFQKQFRSDVKQAEKILNVAIRFYPKLKKVANPQGILDLLNENTLMELDLRNETSHRNELAKIAEEANKHYDLHDMAFPKIYEELSSENVLVSEFLDGPTFDDLLTENKLSYETLLALFRIHGYYIFGVGTFHGDIHPGNIILNDGKIWFIDNGAIGRVDRVIRKGLLKFFKYMSAGDFVGCAHALYEISETEISEEAYQKFEKEFLILYADFDGRTVAEISLTRKMMETIRLGVLSGMTFSQGMYPIVKSLMYLDGMVLRCNPQAVLLKDMGKFIAEFEKAMEGV